MFESTIDVAHVDPAECGWDDGWDEAAAALASATDPGAYSAALLASLDAGQLTAAGRIDALGAWWRLAAWVEANTARLLVAHADAAGAQAGADAQFGSVRLERDCALGEVGLAWGVSQASVRTRHATAEHALTRLPRLFEALEAGRTSVLHLLTVSDLTAQMSEEHTLLVDSRVAERATRMTPAGLRRAARTVATRLDPGSAHRRLEQAHAERRVERFTTEQGESVLRVWAGPRDVQAVWAALTRLAGVQEAGDPRDLGNRRVDPPVEVHVVVDLATLLGLAEHPGELRGYGPIPPGTARDWLRDATTWRRLVTDPVSGHLLDYGPSRRFAPADLAAFLDARDQVCTFPGCMVPDPRPSTPATTPDDPRDYPGHPPGGAP